ncbi:MAG: hypothetical protein JWN94_4235 [Betaproteobacteria bacterium]|nr:hypothetical protein [Betaproteobacteria bacterium]
MVLNSFNGVCCTLVHVVAFAAAAAGTYFFLGTSFENVLTAFVLLGAALALEAVAAVIGRDRTAHT